MGEGRAERLAIRPEQQRSRQETDAALMPPSPPPSPPPPPSPSLPEPAQRLFDARPSPQPAQPAQPANEEKRAQPTGRDPHPSHLDDDDPSPANANANANANAHHDPAPAS